MSAVGFRKKKKSLFLRPMGGCQGIANRVALSSPILMQSGFSRPSSPDRNAAAFLSLTLYVGSTQKKWKWRMDGWWTLNGTGRDGPHAAPEGGGKATTTTMLLPTLMAGSPFSSLRLSFECNITFLSLLLQWPN